MSDSPSPFSDFCQSSRLELKLSRDGNARPCSSMQATITKEAIVEAHSAGAGARASIGRQLPCPRRALTVSDPFCPVPRRTGGRRGEGY